MRAIILYRQLFFRTIIKHSQQEQVCTSNYMNFKTNRVKGVYFGKKTSIQTLKANKICYTEPIFIIMILVDRKKQNEQRGIFIFSRNLF